MSEIMQEIRCAIYTRKSTKEGHDKHLSSTEVQKELALERISNYKNVGWCHNKESYDDPGYSGGNLNRPGIRKLIQHVKQGLVDAVIVYNIDRLSRDLNDGLYIENLLRDNNVTLVSLSENFDLSTPMGRMYPHIMMCQAQFFREDAAERVRAQISIAKQKGFWTGGPPPYGYNVVNKRLIINEHESAQIKHVFQRYTELKSIRKLTDELIENKLTTKTWTSRNNIEHIGKIVDRTYISNLLGNKLYIGQISHKEKSYKGIHEAIITDELFNRVQELRKKEKSKKVSPKRITNFPLQGILFDKDDYVLTTWCSSIKPNGKRYRYYENSRPQRELMEKSRHTRVPADVLENTVTTEIRKIFKNPGNAFDDIYLEKPHIEWINLAKDTFSQLDRRWNELFIQEIIHIIRSLVTKISVLDDSITLQVSRNGLADLFYDLHKPKKNTDLYSKQPAATKTDTTTISVPFNLKRNGSKLRLPKESSKQKYSDLNSVQKAVVRGHKYLRWLESGKYYSLKEIAQKEDIDSSYISRQINLTILSPVIIKSILDDTIKADIGLQDIAINPPRIWEEQQSKLIPKREKYFENLEFQQT